MKRWRMLLGATLALDILSAVALFAEYLALCDIAQVSEPVGEWRVVVVCMIVIGVCIMSAWIMLALLLTRNAST